MGATINISNDAVSNETLGLVYAARVVLDHSNRYSSWR